MQNTGSKVELCARPLRIFTSMLISHMSKTLNVLTHTQAILIQKSRF